MIKVKQWKGIDLYSHFKTVSHFELHWILLGNSSTFSPSPVKSLESHLARSHVARNLSHVARNFSYVARKKKSQVARRNKYQKDLNFRLLIGNNVEKFLSLKRSLFPTTPWRFLKRYSFLITKGNVVRFQQQNEAFFVWYVTVSYSRTFRKLEKLFLGF